MRPVILYSGGLDSYVLAADMILNPYRYDLEPGTCPALVHFTASDAVHAHTTHLLESRQLPALSALANGVLPYKKIVLDTILCTHAGNGKPRPKQLTLSHKSRFACHDIGRSVLFFAVAFNYASEFDSDLVYAAFQMDPERWVSYEADPVNDASEDTPKYVSIINNLADNGGFIPGQRLIAPFLDSRISKANVIRLGVSLGLNLRDTYSCVHSVVPCKKCNACKYYYQAVKILGFDPRSPTKGD